MRDAVGDELEIGIGTHGQFSTAVAIRVADILEEFDPFFFEEPVPPENVDELARVAAHTNIPIATGERLVNMFEFAEVLEKQAAQIIQLDVGQCGGLLVAKKIAGMAETRYAMIAPHMYCGPVAASAAIQLDTCSPNFLIQEFNTNDLHSDIFVEPIKFENGFIEPPTGPGAGGRAGHGGRREAPSGLSRGLDPGRSSPPAARARFGRPKTLEPVGPNGEVLFEYAICDAVPCRLREGRLRHVGGLERRAHDPGRRAGRRRGSRRLRDPEPGRPAGRRVATGRQSEAVGARAMLSSLYATRSRSRSWSSTRTTSTGRERSSRSAGGVAELLDGGDDSHFLAAYELHRTGVSRTSGVNRGILTTGPESTLKGIDEVYDVRETDAGLVGRDGEGEARTLAPDCPCSMNLWAFQPSIFGLLEAAFADFHANLDDPLQKRVPAQRGGR